jgi:L-asparaginase
MSITPRPRCALVTTGGTIVSKIDPSTGLAMPVLSGAELLDSLKKVCNDPGVDIEVHEVCRVSSPHIELEHWVQLHDTLQDLLARDDLAGVVVAHGTATLEETAWFLDLTLASDKPVIVIGAQRNASQYDFDGPRNLMNALMLCTNSDARGKGVLVTLNDHINAAREVTKSHTVDVETFQSGEWGYLGSIVNDRITFHRAPLRRLHVPLNGSTLPRVDIVGMYVGADGSLLEAALSLGSQGIVVQAVASGHLNGAMADAVQTALDKGLPVVISTRIPRGGTRAGYGFKGSSQRLVDAGAVLSGDLSPWKARILLMLAIMNGQTDPVELTRLFSS